MFSISSFSSANTYEIQSPVLESSDTSDNFLFEALPLSFTNSTSSSASMVDVCLDISNLSYVADDSLMEVILFDVECITTYGNSYITRSATFNEMEFNNWVACWSVQVWKKWLYVRLRWEWQYTWNVKITFNGDFINYAATDCSQDSNYLQCIEDLNLSRWQVSTLSGDLNTCQSSLQSCQSNQDAGYLQCQDSLTTCQTNLESQTNYSDSLNTQLQECLANNPSEEDCEGSGCEEILKYDWLFSLFRMNGDEMFSIPVANNIFLPEGYKAYVNSWSVAITQIEKTELTFDDEEFDKVNTLYVDFYVHIAVLLFVCLFVFYIKKFFSKIFSWALKEKQW